VGECECVTGVRECHSNVGSIAVIQGEEEFGSCLRSARGGADVPGDNVIVWKD
jgi:hypothetical protein